MQNELELKTHLKYNQKFGRLTKLEENKAEVVLEATEDMAVDEEGLVHGGFTFSAADFCAMATVNEPFVVLARVMNCEFMAPVKVGDTVTFKGEVILREKRKVEVKVVGLIDEIKVFEGIFSCVVLDKHILKKSKKN
jgi:acyl-coenzyme A thioesterase PaaI-like protein